MLWLYQKRGCPLVVAGRQRGSEKQSAAAVKAAAVKDLVETITTTDSHKPLAVQETSCSACKRDCCFQWRFYDIKTADINLIDV